MILHCSGQERKSRSAGREPNRMPDRAPAIAPHRQGGDSRSPPTYHLHLVCRAPGPATHSGMRWTFQDDRRTDRKEWACALGIVEWRFFCCWWDAQAPPRRLWTWAWHHPGRPRRPPSMFQAPRQPQRPCQWSSHRMRPPLSPLPPQAPHPNHLPPSPAPGPGPRRPHLLRLQRPAVQTGPRTPQAPTGPLRSTFPTRWWRRHLPWYTSGLTRNGR
jgi:hypothetical protein